MAEILLVEDDELISRLLKLRLSSQGHKVIVAVNGREGMEQALAGCFDLVLMDMHMPVMDGHDAVRNLRQQGYRGTVAALSASALARDSQKAIAAGCDHFILKPIGEDFELRVDSMLNNGGEQ